MLMHQNPSAFNNYAASRHRMPITFNGTGTTSGLGSDLPEMFFFSVFGFACAMVGTFYFTMYKDEKEFKGK